MHKEIKSQGHSWLTAGLGQEPGTSESLDDALQIVPSSWELSKCLANRPEEKNKWQIQTKIIYYLPLFKNQD